MASAQRVAWEQPKAPLIANMVELPPCLRPPPPPATMTVVGLAPRSRIARAVKSVAAFSPKAVVILFSRQHGTNLRGSFPSFELRFRQNGAEQRLTSTVNPVVGGFGVVHLFEDVAVKLVKSAVKCGR
jgi:hypothetical protein